MLRYEEKFIYLLKRQGGWCPIGLKKYSRFDTCQDLHHKIVHNTKANRKKYPLFIDSILNLEPVNHDNHLNNPSWGCVLGADKIAEKWERFLEKHPKISDFVNGKNFNFF